MPNLEQISQFAGSLAAEHEVYRRMRWIRRIFPKLEDDNRILIQAYRSTNEDVKSKKDIVPAAEWLLDNFYIIEEQVKEIQHSLPRNFLNELPVLSKGPHIRYPRIYHIAVEMVQFSESRMDDGFILQFLSEYQKETPLRSGELWALPLMIRIALIQKIRGITEYIMESQRERASAEQWADLLLKALKGSQEGLRKVIGEHDGAVGLLKSVYTERLLKQLREEGADAAPIIRWVDGKLALQHTSADEMLQTAHQQQAAYQVAMGNAVTGLRIVSGLRWDEIFEKISLVEHILQKDPASIYGKMDFASRDYYRHALERIAKRMHAGEIEAAEGVVRCAQKGSEKDLRCTHVGHYLIGPGTGELKRELSGKPDTGRPSFLRVNRVPLYLSAIGFFTILLLTLFLYGAYQTAPANGPLRMLLAGLIAFVPILSIVIGFIHWTLNRCVSPILLPKLELKEGIPEEARTMVIIPTLLTNEKRVHELIEQMEVFYLANQEDHLHFALVGDFKDGPREHEPEDEKILKTANQAIEDLNGRYGEERQDIFFYFHRHRVWNEAQKSWMGWERKRGALSEFNRLLSGSGDTSYSTQLGETKVLQKIKYVITLDADTQLPRDAAKKLVGAMMHPLNKPVLNPEGTRVIEGHGLLQPRMGVAVDSAARSFFALTFSGQTGVDPYTTAVSDVYQDLFGEGIFTGKGIYDLEVFNQVLEGTIPENCILSHDLLEGAYVRAGLVTDIELVDGYPAHYIAYIQRLHRWVRGDWQLIPWLLPTVRNRWCERIKNPLHIMAKWKIVDNLRRSLLSPALFLLLILSFTVLPGSFLLWMSLAVATLAFPLVTDLAGSVLSKYQSSYRRLGLADVFDGARNLVFQILLSFVFLAHQAFAMMDAIFKTLWRVGVSKRNMLEWVTAADAERRFKGAARDFWLKMRVSAVISGIFLIWILVFHPLVWPLGAFFALIWAAAPYLAYRISMPKSKRIAQLSEDQIRALRRLARKTWLFFDNFVTKRDHWLPPDNYQTEPPVGTAHRTSPTNIGLYLTSVLSARDLGFIGTSETIERIENTLSSMECMDQWKHHYYNWYDTLTLQPMHPLYVSTVDNGNLIGYLIVLKQGLEELIKRPLMDKGLVLGLQELSDGEGGSISEQSVSLFSMLLEAEHVPMTEWKMLLKDLRDRGRAVSEKAARFEGEVTEWFPWVSHLLRIPPILFSERGAYREVSGKMGILLNMLRDAHSPQGFMDRYHDILKALSETIGSLRRNGQKTPGHPDAKHWLKEMEIALAASHSALRSFIHRCRHLQGRIQEIVKTMDFRLLYDEKQELFSIGYNVEEGQLTKSYYDLLASEARQASFIAIAKGDVPQKHWFKLGRSLTMIGDQRVLLSWSGTMFEYLMPLLIMRDYDYTLLDETYTAVVKGQRQYAEQRHLPWGISESGFYAFDLHLNYQYKAFGIPQLGLKRGLVNDMVVTPYATFLALPIDPAGAYRNLELLLNEGMEGDFGLYEAIDYTPERLPKKRKSMLVKSFMAHHQGMSLLALNNYLNHNPMQARFHSVPMIKATELLLQQRMPRKEIYIKEYENEEVLDVKQDRQEEIRARRTYTTPDTPIPETNLLSNGAYSVMLTNNGGGYSQFQGIGISRWREDATRDPCGMVFYIHNLNSGTFWTAGSHPAAQVYDAYEVSFEPDRVLYHRRDGSIETKTEVVVSPEYNGEVRRLTLTNHSESPRVLDITSYFEVILTTFAADDAHPAFSNLFVQTEFLAGPDALLAARRPRDKKQKPLWLMHVSSVEGESIGSVQYETDRVRFIGRGRDLEDPAALQPEFPLSNTVGNVLDPIMSLRRRVQLHPGGTARVSFITAVADTREGVVALAMECAGPAASERAFELAWTHGQVELRYLNMTAGQANLYQTIASSILFSGPKHALRIDAVSANRKGQADLWAYGISGDLPIVLIRVEALEEMDLVKQMLTAHEYWRLKGLMVDLVLLNDYGTSYEQPVQERLRDLVAVSHAREMLDKPGGVYLRQTDIIPAEDVQLLMAVARLVLRGSGGPVLEQLAYNAAADLPELLQPTLPDLPQEETEALPEENLIFYNDLGGFSQDGSEYVLRLKGEVMTPMPWSNVVANPETGFLVTECGSGYSWRGNSRENKLTPWSNDPVRDPSGEILYLRDDETGAYFTVTPLPLRDSGEYRIRHGQGYSIFEHHSHGLHQEQLLFVPRKEPAKVCRLRLSNTTDRPRHLSLIYYAEWVLGVLREKNAPFIVTDFDEVSGAITAQNRYMEEFPERQAFLVCSLPTSSVTGDRTEFIGRNGTLKAPAALQRIGLSGHTGSAYDPCAALQTRLTLAPGETAQAVFLLGQAQDLDEIRALAQAVRQPGQTEAWFAEVQDFWQHTLTALQVRTPDASMDLMLNRWLLYQTYACRIMARTAFYQAGGAYGFRDQLQDVMALAYSAPDRMKDQILNSAAHQFEEGDVQHWWHPPRRGVRTRIADDLLFLPYVTADYIEITGDDTILDTQVPFLTDSPLKPEEHDRYSSPEVSKDSADLYTHCVRALDRTMAFGSHGLPLMGGGDWNDGMDQVGIEGKGESVWLGWFLYATIQRFIPLCKQRQDPDRAFMYQRAAQQLLEAIERHGWDGGWYLRAYFDDGRPMGSEQNSECRIDSISQSWSVISGGARQVRAREAMRALEHHLVNRQDGLIKLLTPPFAGADYEPGYIKGYVPGVRENGGQYTHAAIWSILAFAKLGEGDKANNLFHLINPINHTRTWIELSKYKTEPYVTAADVYAAEPHMGRGGWSWYTGSSSWMYRVGAEHLLGFKLTADTLRIEPCIPHHWKEYELTFRRGDTCYSIKVLNPKGVSTGVESIQLDGVTLPEQVIPVKEDGQNHEVLVQMGQPQAKAQLDA